MEVPVGKKMHTHRTAIAIYIGCGLLTIVMTIVGLCCYSLAHSASKEAPHSKSEVYILKDEVVE